MKIPDVFHFDKRIINRVINSNPEHRHKLREYSSKLEDNSENIETLAIHELFPIKKGEEEK